MNPEMHPQEPVKKPLYEKPQGIPVGDGWLKVGNYYTKELPTGGVQKLSKEEWEKRSKYSGLRETVSKGLEMQAREKIRQEALESARKALQKEFGGLKSGDHDVSH